MEAMQGTTQEKAMLEDVFDEIEEGAVEGIFEGIVWVEILKMLKKDVFDEKEEGIAEGMFEGIVQMETLKVLKNDVFDEKHKAQQRECSKGLCGWKY